MTSHEQLNHQLLKRIDRLERRYRHLQIAALAFIALTGAAVVFAQNRREAVPVKPEQALVPPPDPSAPAGLGTREVIEAAGFAVKDAAGVTRAQIGLEPGGNSPFISLSDASGVIRMIFTLDKGEPRIALRDPQQHIRMSMGSQEEGKAYSMGMYGASGEERASMYLRRNTSGFEFGNPKGEYVSATATQNQDVSGTVTMNGNSMRANLGIVDGKAMFRIFDRAGAVIYQKSE